jgi:hypothetical protein
MANIIETSTFEPAIHELGVDELVLGGLNGPSNTPLKQLANRTKWLKDAVDALESGGGPFAYNASAGTLPVGGTDGPGVAGIKRKDYYFCYRSRNRKRCYFTDRRLACSNGRRCRHDSRVYRISV